MKKYLSIPLSATLSFFLGWLWYSPFLFGKFWQESYKGNINESNMLIPTIVGFVLMNVMAFGMWWLVRKTKLAVSYVAGLKLGLHIALLFVLASMGIGYVYQGYSLMMFLVDAGYQLGMLAVMGTLTGGWKR